jgi:enoyl-CoA hydratase
MLAESGKGDGAAARSFFLTEYRLNHLLHVFPKPIVAFMDGVTMGGGVGISDPAPYRVATERTTYAMPETGIGLFPDVGGGWHLPRLPGKVGLWLALTGARIKAADCLAAGLCTHFVASGDVPVIFDAVANAADPVAALRKSLDAAQASPGPVVELTPEHRAIIDRAFAAESVEAIFAALEQAGDPWSAAQLKTLHTKCPQTMKVAFRQLNLGAGMKSFADVMRMEYRIGARMVQKHDFWEGVRAVIVDKDNAPKWNPATLADVREQTLDEIFAPLPADEEWTPLV